MKDLIDKNNLKSAEQLKEHIPFGLNCRLCMPYVELIIKTGMTEFDPIKFEGGMQ